MSTGPFASSFVVKKKRKNKKHNSNCNNPDISVSPLKHNRLPTFHRIDILGVILKDGS